MFGAPENYAPTPIDLPATTDKHGAPIVIGSRVRSFDFDSRDLEGKRACYIEGVVVGAVEHFGAPSYLIATEARYIEGWERPVEEGQQTIAPINGLRSLSGRTDGVEVIRPDATPRYRVTYSVTASHVTEGVETSHVIVPETDVEVEAADADTAIRTVAGWFNTSSVDVNIRRFSSAVIRVA